MHVRRAVVLMSTVLLVCFVLPAAAQFTHLDWRMHNVGKVRQVVTNMGTFSKGFTRYPGLINAEFPAGSDEEHLYQAGLWVGAITPNGDTAVSTTQTHFSPFEFYPSAASWDSIWSGEKGDTLNIPYWPGYVAVSNQDFVCRYSDYNLLNIEDHIPLYLDVVQTSYAWSSGQLDEFLLYTYRITPTKFPLKNAWIGFWMHGSVGNVAAADNFIDEYTYYFPKYHMAVDDDSPGWTDGTAVSPIGFSVMSPTDPSLTWTFKYYEHEELPNRDPAMYKEMSSGMIMPNRVERARAHIILAFGPLNVNVGDTVVVEMAEIFGYGMTGLLKNAEYLTFLKSKNFHVPSPPPVPQLNVATSSHTVHLSWTPPSGRQNPELYTDPNRGDTVSHPFEGYRLYKSTKGENGPWTLLAEYDVINNLKPNTGLSYEYEDKGLLNNIEYYYTLTTFSQPDRVINFPSQETSLTVNAKRVIPGTAPPETVGEVAAVPNPYRGDIAYNSYNPPWERAPIGRQWMEQDRRIQFINLPAECVIRIYTLAGDLVNTIRHDNPTKGYEDWNLTSTVGQAVSSGLYLFTVEDVRNGKVQVGKFVIIK